MPKAHVESHLALSVRSLKTLGLRDTTKNGVFSFRRENSTLAEISYEASTSKIKLWYQGKSAQGQVSIHRHSIQLATSLCHFGGVRYWLQCPGCFKNKYHLYFIQNSFLCRQCAGLAYRLSALSKDDRLYAAKHRLGREIFNDYQNGTGTERRKGMHSKTYHQKLKRYLSLQEQLIKRFELKFEVSRDD